MKLPQVVRASESQAVRPPARSAAVMSASTAATAAVLTTVALAAVSWVVTIARMDGMDMGVDTELGSFGFFVARCSCSRTWPYGRSLVSASTPCTSRTERRLRAG
jgi:hypothetical protein